VSGSPTPPPDEAAAGQAGKTPPPATGSPRPQTEISQPASQAAEDQSAEDQAAQAQAAQAQAAEDQAAAPGGKIAGYRLEQQIGEGGMAVVYRAYDERLGRRVALKLLAPGLAADAGFRHRFIRESRVAAAVDHPNIIPIYEAGEADGALFIAMRYVQDGDVRSLLEAGGPLPAGRAWAIIRQVAAALDAAHAHGLVHRDVKPANMLLDASAAAAGQPGARSADGKPEHVYLSDFGISKQSLSTSNVTMTGQFVGTLDYIAPEQIDGRSVDGRADLYSLGCAAYELLSGMPPFRRDRGLALISAHLTEPPPSLAARRDDLPRVVDSVLATAMAKSPDDRYATCALFAADLGRSLGLVPGEPEPLGTPRHPGPGAGGQAASRPATALAGYAPAAAPAPAPDAGQARGLSPGGQDVWPAQSPQPAAPTALGNQGPSGAPGGFDQAAMYRGSQGPPGGASPPGPAGGYGQYGSYPPASPAWPAQPQQQPKAPQPPQRRSRGVIVAVIVAVVAVAAAAAAVIYIGHHRAAPTTPVSAGSTVSPTTSASPSSSASAPAASASTEANAVSSLLASGADSSTRLNNAVNSAMNCVDPSQDVRQIGQVRDQRRTEYSQAQGLSTGALQNGAALKSDLTQALFYSLGADNNYLGWARRQLNSGCQVGSQSTTVANTNNQQAVIYKDMFVNLWNPVASQFGLPPASQTSM
jgi:serine/threonine protein kinase